MSCSDESKRRHDNFASKPNGLRCNFQAHSSVAHCNAVLDTYQLTELVLELLHVGTIVCQPSSIDKIVDTCQQALAVANVRATNVKLFIERGASTENC